MAAEKKSVLIRLNPEVYRELENKLLPPTVVQGTTDIQAGFLLGIQHTLKLLRDGYTIGA